MDTEIWEDEFYNEIEERGVPGDWMLHEEEGLYMEEKGAKYTQRTFGRFQCSGCKRWWNSAEIHVLFCMNLNRTLQQGTVKMRIFKQECKKCSFAKLEKPEISHENIIRIITNLVNRILQVFYGKKKAKQDLKPEVYSKDMEGPHDKEHCEACKLLICKWQTIATQKQPAVTSSSDVKKPAHKPKKHKKSKQCSSDGMTSYSSKSTATYPNYETDFQYSSATPTYETEKWQTVATKKQPAVTSSSDVKKPAQKPKKHKKSKQSRSDGMTSYSLKSTATYPDYETDFPSTYSDYETDFRYFTAYPTYETERYTAYSPPRKTEKTSFPVVASLIAGFGALALWYFKR